MSIIRTILFSLLFINLIACHQPQASDTLKGKAFFDLKAYFEQELIELSKQSFVTKVVELNGVQEKKVIEYYDFSNEVSLFINSDINKIAWLDKYTVDSVFNSSTQQLNQLIYTALDEQLRTRQLSISFENDIVDAINIENLTSSILVEAHQLLTYRPNKQILIDNHQKLLFFDDRDFKIQIDLQ